MALKHQLSLNIVDGCDPTNFTIIDTSNYAPGVPILCPTLAITIPSQAGPLYFSQGTLPDPNASSTDPYYTLPTCFIPYNGDPKFVFTVNNIFLQQQTISETLDDLSDGLYVISYCVAPCDSTKVEYYYLRTTKAMHLYHSLLCKLRLGNCLPDEETIRAIDQLHIIKMYLDSAKAKTEVCHAPNEGMHLYEYAMHLMNDWQKTCCATCY